MSIVVEPFVRTFQQDTAAHTSAHRHIDRQLRAAAERTLWQHLQDCRLGGAKFRRQHLVELYLADFVCMDARLVIELCSTLTPSLALHASTRRATRVCTAMGSTRPCRPCSPTSSRTSPRRTPCRTPTTGTTCSKP